MSDPLRIAEESQLLAEEKWLIETLTKVRKQRNCLQIERLHLQTLVADYEDTINRDYEKRKPGSRSHKFNASPSASASNNGTAPESGSVPQAHMSSLNQSNLDEATGEDLDLSVSRSVFNVDFREGMMEEYEEDDFEDASEKVVLDINMLMNLKNDD